MRAGGDLALNRRFWQLIGSQAIDRDRLIKLMSQKLL